MVYAKIFSVIKYQDNLPDVSWGEFGYNYNYTDVIVKTALIKC